MRSIVIACLVSGWCSPLLAKPADTVAPGMNLGDAKAILEKHGYEVDAKYYLAMDARDKNSALEFCRIDKNFTLVITFKKSTQQVESLGVVIFPNVRSTKLHQVFRKVHEIALEDDGIYTLKLQRAPKRVAKSP